MFVSIMVINLANQMAQKEVDCSLIQGFPQGIEGGCMTALSLVLTAKKYRRELHGVC